MTEPSSPTPKTVGRKTKIFVSLLLSLFVLYVALGIYKFAQMLPNPLWRTQTLIKTLTDETDKKLSMLAGQELAKRGPKVVPQIIAVLNQSKTSQYAGAFALGEAGDKQAVEPLAGLLNSDDESIRYRAAYALAQLGDQRGVDYLKAALAKADGSAKFQMEIDLKRLGL